MRDDRRLLDTWSSQVKMWEIGHGITISVRDLDSAEAWPDVPTAP